MMTFYKVAYLWVFIYTINKMVTVGEEADLRDIHLCDFHRHLYVTGPRSCVPCTKFNYLLDMSTEKHLKWMEHVKSCEDVLN